jgi:hypothetical protein
MVRDRRLHAVLKFCDRVPRVPNDPACSLPLWEDYMENMRSEEKGDMTKFDSRKALLVAKCRRGFKC